MQELPRHATVKMSLRSTRRQLHKRNGKRSQRWLDVEGEGEMMGFLLLDPKMDPREFRQNP